MIFNTAAGVVPLAPASAINAPLAPSANTDVSARVASFVSQTAAPVVSAPVRQEKVPVERANTNTAPNTAPNTARTENTLFLAQVFGAEDTGSSIESDFVQATAAYRNLLTPVRQYTSVLPPETLQAFSEVKYKPGLKPPEDTARRLSLVA